ncbi:MAG: protein arginine kinase [Oscillospiraceae bacterium]|nr:protein arginine kinase [Oscillospiraceae bacterium]
MTESKKWQCQSGAEGDVVISTRIRLARNLPKLPFPCRMNEEQARIVERSVCRAVEHSSDVLPYRLGFTAMQDLTRTEKLSLVERHLASPAFIAENEGRALFLSPDERVSILVNEEDHLRIQSMAPGLALEQAYEVADDLDDALNTSLHFAFDKKLGYLTQCPTNLGTGMRSSVMLHLPALQSSGQLYRMASHLSKLGLTLRGTYGEGSESVGALYQLSNQVSLGLSEGEAMSNLKSITMQLVGQERETRKQIARSDEKVDRIARSLGLLQSARLLSGDEFMQLISNVRLGVAVGVLPGPSFDTINGLLVDTQPATLSLAHGGGLSEAQRDAARAELVRDTLARSAKIR